MLIKSILIWLSIIPLAILNGGLRQYILEPFVGIKIANPISCLILCCLSFIVSLFFIPRLGNGSVWIYTKMGLLWVLLTIVFETIINIFEKMTLKEIINTYNITAGNYWLMVVIFIGFVPWLVAKVKKII
jgi:hypothetical protein